MKNVQWWIKAPETKWKKFRHELGKLKNQMTEIFMNEELTFEMKYAKWYKKIDAAARMSIGKTTIKNKSRTYDSEEIKRLRVEKRQLKKSLAFTNDKPATICEYKRIQEKLRILILEERAKEMNDKMENMIKDKTKIQFWKLRKKLMRNEVNECLTVKNVAGKRVYDPEEAKEVHANHYEGLYANKEKRSHNHHQIVQEEIQQFITNYDYDNEWYNELPTDTEIMEAIREK